MPKLLDTTKPFAQTYFATDAQATAINPNGWLMHDASYSVTANPSDFRSRMLSLATTAKNEALAMGADVIYTWDLPFGQRLPHVWTYYGDPTVWQTLCPELTTVTSGKTLLTEMLEIFTNASLKVAWTLRPQRALVQASLPLPTDTTIDWVLVLDRTFGSQLYHWDGSAWVVASTFTTGYGQHQPYGSTFPEGELTRKLNYISTNFPQITHFYIDTTVDPDGQAYGDFDTTFWKRLKTAFPTFVFSQEQESINDSIYYSGDTPSSAGYGQLNLWDVSPAIRETDMRPNAQRLITLKDGTDNYPTAKPWLVEAVARGFTKVGGQGYDIGDVARVNEVLSLAASWTPPSPNPWTTVSTNDISAWTIEGYQGAGYVPSASQGSIVGNALRITSGTLPWARGWRRLSDMTPGEQRLLKFTVVHGGAAPFVSIRKADNTSVYASGDLTSGTYQTTITVPAGTNALYLYFTADEFTGSADLSDVSFAVASTLDTTPNAFSFTDVTSAALSTVYTSNAITVTGINSASPISVTGGEYRINSGAWVTASGTVNVNDTVQVRGTSSSANSTTVNVVLDIGGISDTYSITTLAGSGGGGGPAYSQDFNSVTVADLMADGWHFYIYTPDGKTELNSGNVGTYVTIVSGQIHLTYADPNFWTTAERTVSGLTAGISTPVTIDVVNAEQGYLRVWDGIAATGTMLYDSSAVTGPATISSSFTPTGTQVRVQFGIWDFGALTYDNLTIGSGSSADTTPNAFSFTDVTGAAVSTVYTSNAITVAGINAASAISVTGGEYRVNGGTWVTSSGTVNAGDSIQVRRTSSGSLSTTVSVVLTIGGVSDTFSITTGTGGTGRPGNRPSKKVKNPKRAV